MAQILNVHEAAQEAQDLNIFLPHANDGKTFSTKNRSGFMYATLNSNDRAFIELASEEEGKRRVLDIGCAYGYVCLAALRQGARDVTAVDMDPDHLRVLAKTVQQEQPENMTHLKLVVGTFPNQDLLSCLTNDGEFFFDAILARNVLHFVHESEMQKASDHVFQLLKPGGKFFATSITPYTRNMKAEVREACDYKLLAFQKELKRSDYSCLDKGKKTIACLI